MQIDRLLQQLDIGEDQDIEFKAATDQSLPKSIWESVSAFANTKGGYIVLGIAQTCKDKFEITGVNNPNNLKKMFWDTHNNAEKLNIPICRESDIQILTYNNYSLLTIYVPCALRTQRPIYINNNPKTGT